jgi:hypothetical protein
MRLQLVDPTVRYDLKISVRVKEDCTQNDFVELLSIYSYLRECPVFNSNSESCHQSVVFRTSWR